MEVLGITVTVAAVVIVFTLLAMALAETAGYDTLRWLRRGGRS